MAHSVIHAAITAEMAALYWIGSGREEKRRRKIFATMAIIFCGFLVDIDHFLVDGGDINSRMQFRLLSGFPSILAAFMASACRSGDSVNVSTEPSAVLGIFTPHVLGRHKF